MKGGMYKSWWIGRGLFSQVLNIIFRTNDEDGKKGDIYNSFLP